MKNNLAIFDLDGTLFNTDNVNYLSYKQALEEQGFSLDYEYYCKKCNGNHYTTFLPKITNRESFIIEKIHDRKKELYSTFLDSVKVNVHLFNIIEALKSTFNLAVVTTASRKNCEEILEYFDKRRLFDLVLTHEDVKNFKPDPEGFLIAMNKMNVLAENTIIFEDSDLGIEAARRSGATVFKADSF